MQQPLEPALSMKRNHSLLVISRALESSGNFSNFFLLPARRHIVNRSELSTSCIVCITYYQFVNRFHRYGSFHGRSLSIYVHFSLSFVILIWVIPITTSYSGAVCPFWGFFPVFLLLSRLLYSHLLAWSSVYLQMRHFVLF